MVSSRHHRELDPAVPSKLAPLLGLKIRLTFRGTSDARSSVDRDTNPKSLFDNIERITLGSRAELIGEFGSTGSGP